MQRGLVFCWSNTKRHFQAIAGDILLVTSHYPSAKLLMWHEMTCLKHLKRKWGFKRLLHQGLIDTCIVSLSHSHHMCFYCTLFSQLSWCKTRSFVSLHFIASHVKWSCYTYSTGAPVTRRVMLHLASWSHFRRYSGFSTAHTLRCQCSESVRGGLAVEVMKDWIAGDEICAVVYHSWCRCWGVRTKSTKVEHFWKLAFCPVLNL